MREGEREGERERLYVYTYNCTYNCPPHMATACRPRGLLSELVRIVNTKYMYMCICIYTYIVRIRQTSLNIVYAYSVVC